MSEEKTVINKLLLGAGIAAFGTVVSKIITYFFRLVVARIGPDAYGQLSLGLTVMGISSVFVQLGLDESIKKFVPEAKAEEDLAKLKGIVLDSLKIITVSGILVGSVIFFSADLIAKIAFNSPETAPIIRVLAFAPLLSRITGVFIDTTLGFNSMKYKAITIQITQNIAQLAVTLGLITLSYGVVGAAMGWMAGVIVSLPLGYYFMEKNFGPIVTADVKAKKMYPEMIKYSYPLIFSGILWTGLSWGDTAMLGYFLEDSAVGLYNAALPTAALIGIAASALGGLALPSFSELGAKKSDKSWALKTTTRWSFILTLPAFLLMLLFSDQLLHLLFGPTYAQAGTALAIIAFGNFYANATGQLNAYLKSDSHTKLMFYNTAANLTLNIILNLLLIPRIGILGAAIATAASTVFVNSLLLLETYRIEGTIPFNRQMVKAIPPGILSLGLTYIVFEQLFSPAPYWILIPAGITFMITYTLTLLKTGGLTEYDKEIIITTGRKIGRERETERILETLT